MRNRLSVVPCDEAGFVKERGTGDGDFEEGAVGDGVKEAEEGEFGGRETGGEGVGADLRDVEGLAGEGREDEAVPQVGVRGEFEGAGGHICAERGVRGKVVGGSWPEVRAVRREDGEILGLGEPLA